MRQEQFERALQQEDLNAVWRFLVYRLGPDAAEDAYQDVFAEATRSFSRFDPRRGSLAGWLIGVSRNVVRRHRAIAALREGISLDDAEFTDRLICDRALWSAGDIDQGLHQMPLVIREALCQLPEVDRTILWKTTIFGLSTEVVGRRLGMQQSAVTTRLSRIRARLRPMLIVPDDRIFGEAF